MKRFIITVAVVLSVSSVTLAGDIPGSNPGGPPPCTENCMRVEAGTLSAEPTLPTDLSVSIVEIVSGIFALVF